MEDAKPAAVPDHKAQDLQQAFAVFNQVSLELTQAYEGLQARVVSLTAELAVANGELRQQYQEKEALSERLSLLLKALPAGVVVLDHASLVSEANPVAIGMFGAEVVGSDWSQLAARCLEPTDAPDEWLLGERRVSIAESPLDSAGGRLLLVHDITAAHDMKVSAERSQRLAAMGEMAASLAHQLRTPLATALLYSANLAQPELAEGARLRFAGKATDQLKRLERLIQDVLLFARGESIGRDRVPVDSLLTEVLQTIEPQCQSKGIRLAARLVALPAIVTGSRKALAGALLNLLENAVQACEDAGREDAEVGLAATIDDGWLRVVVRDTGGGISPEVQARIFEPFYTTRGQGTGLGLAIALGVARAHGGGIELRSLPGQGAQFLLRLPVAVVADAV